MRLNIVFCVVSLVFLFTDVVAIVKSKYIQCPSYSSQLTNLFTIMCNNIANGTNNTLQDACNGCFQRASTPPSVSSIVVCATTYLLNTNYSSCFNLPTSAPPTVTTTVATTTAAEIDPRLKRSLNVNCNNEYCEYVRCIRTINANILIAGCYAEARVSNNATYPDQQVALYKNMTACILAKSRCSSMNPITGQLQNGRYMTQTLSKFGKTLTPYYYALQISESGELRIIGLPNTVAIQRDFCALQSNLVEATWTNFVC